MAKSDYEIQDPSTGQWSPYTGQSGTGNIRSGGTTYSYYAGQNAYNNEADPVAAPTPTPDPGPIPTDPGGGQTGGATPWDPGSSAPSSAPPGYHWDPKLAMYQPDAPSSSGGGTGGTGTTPPPPSTAPPPSVAPPAQPSGGPVAPPAQPSGGPVAPPAAPSNSGNSGGVIGGGAATTPGPAPPAAAAPSNPADDAFRQSIRDSILKALGQGPVSADDADIAPAITANRVATERGLADQRAQIAERLNAQGLTGSGSLDQQMQAARERATTGEAQFSGNTVLNQAIARRQQLLSLLGMGSTVMTADDARALQGRIADIDAYLRQQSITNQNQQANDQMGLTGSYYQALLREQQIRDMLGQ